MRKEIQVGDLVYLLQTTNPAHNELSGQVRTVEEPSMFNHGEWRLNPPDYHDGRRLTWHSIRLKRIPPLDELEGQRTEEGLREPVCN